ncbi:endolytic transglycosylase MltG [Xanthomonas hyacinthi]|uniref:Endolytic murein transglycosylase n=1 Tax=Xanthomonas hyacinthi TaxID=56455 RepID=A0A2S7ETD2_9XANT|nr:endolytic transglycosylase MltG [Xanthomonas hyacinthi]KLD73716.1 aminodeoxychorismate lyase [Xanthomonas hyacinthi DSM 19077]PPU96391.1 aminodeoxychorismate lyase [Xanthomonas hyacinthi]QGY77884.1 endolytic transglycosylase MltG [Xanthomonas hyacinthi]
MAWAKRGCLTLLATLLVFALLVAAAGAWWWQGYRAFADQPLQAAQSSVEVAHGDSFNGVLRKLRAAGVEQGSSLQWQLLARQLDAAGKLKVGEYALQPALSPRELLLRMRKGQVIHYRFTIVEGWNIRQLRSALNAATPLRHVATELGDSELMARLGQPGQHPEGRFLPETYLYQRGDSDLDVLQRARAALDKALAEAWGARAAKLPLQSPEQALTLASIVEKETGLAAERPQIAGVFVRRLQQGMKLQTDPAVIYGIGSAYDGNIRKRDLETDTPYNTYTRSGLPPTPIAMPGRDALRAATDPAPGDSLYFVAVGDGSGAHAFSASYAEHAAAVARYLQRLRQARSGTAVTP